MASVDEERKEGREGGREKGKEGEGASLFKTKLT